MAQDVALQEFKWLAEMSLDSDDFSDASAGGRGEVADQLSIKDNVFTFKTSEGTTDAPNPRQVYIVYLGGKKPKSRSLYQGAFNDDDLQAPVCSSQDGVNFEPGSQVPVISDPNHPRCGQEARNCRECPMAKWGSAISVKTGKAVPACKEHKEILVKVLGVPGAWLFKLPPASFANWDKATAKLKLAIAADKAAHDGQTTLCLGNAVFTASFGPGMGNILFEPCGYLAKIPEELAQVAELRRDQDTLDKMLWGSVERKHQYEGDMSPPARGQLAPTDPQVMAAVKGELDKIDADTARVLASPDPLAVQVNRQASKDMAKLQQAQATLRAAAQAASEALEAKREATLAPEQPAKKASKPSPYKDVGSILKGMGLPG